MGILTDIGQMVKPLRHDPGYLKPGSPYLTAGGAGQG
jgi:hypothetical protein